MNGNVVHRGLDTIVRSVYSKEWTIILIQAGAQQNQALLYTYFPQELVASVELVESVKQKP